MDKLSVINAALMKCGLPLAASLQDADWGASSRFDSVTEQLLRAHAWNFATAYATPGQSGTPAHGYLYSYPVPADCVRVLDVRAAEDVRAPQAVGTAAVNVAVFQIKVRAHLFQPLEVLIHGTRPDGATARERHARPAYAGQQGPQTQHGRPHGLHEIIWRLHAESAVPYRDHAVFDRGNVCFIARPRHRLIGGVVGRDRSRKRFTAALRQRICLTAQCLELGGGDILRIVLDKRLLHTRREGQKRHSGHDCSKYSFHSDNLLISRILSKFTIAVYLV